MSFVILLSLLAINWGEWNADVESKSVSIEMETEKDGMDWFYRQRAYPHGTIPPEALARARNEAARLKAEDDGKHGEWTLAGPVNIGGRITAISALPNGKIVVGAADGGVFISNDSGHTWTPVFDTMMSLSIGAVTIDTSNNAIYVGTGEANSSGDSFDGNGLYVTFDDGNTWSHLGLDSTAHIARIVINPLNNQEIYVAAMGHLFSTDTTRGVYKSTDGGQTWQKVLFVNDTTGCIDIAINPQDTNIIYAAMWSRIRTPEMRRVSGVGSGIYRSTDGGATRERLTNGLPSQNVGRIGLAISPTNPNVLYAIIADHPGYLVGVFKTTDGGDTWFETNDGIISDLFSSYGWYFGQIRVSPSDPDKAYAMGLDIFVTTDGGNSWQQLTGWDVHVDHHDLWISPQDDNYLIDGNDGGVYISTNGGNYWRHVENLPITQFYDVAIDPNNPMRLYGGAQDNGTVRTLSGSIDDWDVILWGDGFLPMIDPRNSNIVFAEWQYGNLEKSTDMGYNFYYCLNGVSSSDRRNWDTPYAMTPSNPDIMYYGTYRIYKSVNEAESWTPVSGDLTNGPGAGNLVYGTITAIKVSPSDPNRVYVGTDDGNVWVSPDAGGTWVHVSDSLPDRYVTDIAVDPNNSDRFYVTFSGYEIDDDAPYIFVTSDFGTTWTDITGNLPHAPVNAVEVDPEDTNTIYVGTDFGVFYSETGGGNWTPLGSGMPNSVVMDLALDPGSRTLIAGTHGRSMFKISLTSVEEDENPLPRSGSNIAIRVEGGIIRVLLSHEAEGNVTARLISVDGRVLRETHAALGSKTIDIPAGNLPDGIYIVDVRLGRQRRSEKLVILR